MNSLTNINYSFYSIFRKTSRGAARKRAFLFTQNIKSMKKFFTYFTPRNYEERESLIGFFCGLAILAIVFYFYSI